MFGWFHNKIVNFFHYYAVLVLLVLAIDVLYKNPATTIYQENSKDQETLFRRKLTQNE